MITLTENVCEGISDSKKYFLDDLAFSVCMNTQISKTKRARAIEFADNISHKCTKML